MKFLRAIAVLLVLCLATVAAIVPKGQEAQHSATHRIVMEDAVDAAGCSATAVGPHTLLTAGHCFVPSHSMIVDDDRVKVTGVDWDEDDHLLIRVDEKFDSFLPVVQRDLVPGEEVHMWGNPGRSRDVYRIGAVEKVVKDEDAILTWFLMPGAPGDSGSGILDASGKIVAVLSIGNENGEVGAFELAFSPAQLASVN